MGNFYVNHTVCGQNLPAVVEQLKGSDAFISRHRNSCFVVFDNSWMEGPTAIEKTGRMLSSVKGTHVLSVAIADDDVMNYWLFKDGEIVDSYDSNPDFGNVVGTPNPPKGGDASKLCAAFGCENFPSIESVLRTQYGVDGYLFETERHKALVALLKLPQEAVAVGFNYLDAGEFPEGFGPSDFERVTK